MRYLICGVTYINARNKLEKLLTTVAKEKVIVARGKDYFETSDGDYYRAVCVDSTLKGVRVDKLYVSGGIDEKIVNVVYLPMMCGSKLPEEDRVEWF